MAPPLKHTDFTEPEDPICAHCGGRDLIRGGSANGKKRYRCRECGHRSHGIAPPPRENRYPCPHCGGRCQKSGRSPKGSQRYICTGCKKKNTDLYPEPPRSPGGPFRHRITFYLGPWAARNLCSYCNATGMSAAQAVRHILRQPARPAFIATIPRTYDGSTPIPRIWSGRQAPEIRFANEPLRDLRREVTWRRMQGGEDARYRRTVAVDAKVSLVLDDLAKEGLVKTMRARKLNHQEAARYLISEARIPPQKR